jgi:phytoene dehydrogenase-like protein
MKRRVVVLGAGVGGAASAALLARSGHEVTLLEAHPYPGGRCASFDRDGFRFDFGVHMFSRGEKGPHGEVARRIGVNLPWILRDPPCWVTGGTGWDFPLDIKPLRRRMYLARRLAVRTRNLAGAYRLFHLLLSGRRAEEYDSLTLQALAFRYTDDENLHRFLTCVAQLYFALSYEEASAGEFAWSFSRMFQDASFGYPSGGAGAIPGCYLEGLKRSGGKVLYGQRATRILVEDGAARGVETASGAFQADLVVSSAGLLRTVELAGREHFPEAYVRRAEEARGSNAYVTIKYGLDRRVVPHPVVFHIPELPPEEMFRHLKEGGAPRDPFLFMPVPTEWDPSLAPAGCQIVIAGTPAPAGAPPELCKVILDAVHGRVCDLFPGIESATLWQSRSTRADVTEMTGHPEGEAIGLAQTPDQVGPRRPDIETPVRGLLLVGADAGARGIGTEMAAASAMRLADWVESRFDRN